MPAEPDDCWKTKAVALANKVYEQAIAPWAKELSALSASLCRLLRPIVDRAASFTERLEPTLKRIEERIPAEQRVDPPIEFLGPLFERMRYVEKESELWAMYEELLTQSMDRETASRIHPSFTYIISQLSRDEALLLAILRDAEKFSVVIKDDFDAQTNTFSNRQYESSEIPVDDLYLPEHVELYYSHLESLQLVRWPVLKTEYPHNDAGVQIGLRRETEIRLTDFGKLFVSAAVPPTGFERSA